MDSPLPGTDQRSQIYHERFQVQIESSKATGPIYSYIHHEDDKYQAALQPSLSNHRQTFPRYPWIWEFLACLFSAICSASVLGVLLYEDGKELDHWNLNVLPNVVVSFIAMLAKASLVFVISQALSQLKWIDFQSRPLSHIQMYDCASRGPWGAFLLVFKSRRLIALMAGTLMLLTLLVDPFVQLVFSFPSESRDNPHQQATLQRTQIYTPSGYYVSFLYPNIGSTSIPTDMSATINNAFNSAPLQYVNTCPSGNCTWPSITTLGVCGSCQDVTADVSSPKLVYKRTTPNDTALICSYSYANWPPLFLRAEAVYPAPGSFPYPNQRSGDEDYVHVISSLWNSSLASVDFYGLYRAQAGSKAVLGNFWGIQSKLTDPRISEKFPIKAVLCENYFCEKTLNISVSNSMVNVNKLSEEPLYLARAWIAESPPEHDIMNLYKLKEINRTDVEPYQTDHSLGYSLILQLHQTFNIASRKYQSLTNHDAGFWCEGPGCTTQAGTAFSTTTDFNATINRLSDFMTETIRTGENSTNVIGTVFVTQTFIRVRWEWLGLPLGLLLSTSLLLAFIAIQTHAANTPVWKDNPLVLLFLQIDGFDTRRLSSSKDLDAIARQTRVRLSPDRPFTLVDFKHDESRSRAGQRRASSQMTDHGEWLTT